MQKLRSPNSRPTILYGEILMHLEAGERHLEGFESSVHSKISRILAPFLLHSYIEHRFISVAFQYCDKQKVLVMYFKHELSWLTSLAIILCLSSVMQARLLSDKKVLNVCMDGRHQLHEPQSLKLHGLCKPWESKSCCSNVTSFHSHYDASPLYNFNISHCGPVSNECLQRFTLSNCFYECSPNVGPWLQLDRSSIRNERYFHVPLCKSECEAWWNDCKNQLTCTDNWSKGFVWKDRTNTCPPESQCRNYTEVFHNATNFCQTVFRDDYIVTEDDSNCMKFSFKGPVNPNAEVAKTYAIENKMAHPDKEVITNPTTVTDATTKIIITRVMPYDPPTRTPILNQPGTTVAIALTAVFLVVILLGIVVCKWREMMETSRRSGVKCCPCFSSWYGSGVVVHRPAPTDDRAFLQAEDDDNLDLNPHGTLEINL